MFKIMVKTALKVLLALVIVLAVAFGALSLGYPSGLASFFENCGNYSFASGYAALNYKYTGKIEDLDRCFVDCVYAGDDEYIVYYGEKLVAANNNGFETLCKARDEQMKELGLNYRHYVLGKVACSKYRRGDLDGALSSAKSAFESGEGFPKGNALISLMLTAKTDTVFLEEKLKPAVLEITPLESQTEDYQNILKEIDALLS